MLPMTRAAKRSGRFVKRRKGKTAAGCDNVQGIAEKVVKLDHLFGDDLEHERGNQERVRVFARGGELRLYLANEGIAALPAVKNSSRAAPRSETLSLTEADTGFSHFLRDISRTVSESERSSRKVFSSAAPGSEILLAPMTGTSG